MIRRRILLIHRDTRYREALANLLSSEGHSVAVAGLGGIPDAMAGFDGDTMLCDAAILQSDPGLADRARSAGARLVVIGDVEPGPDGPGLVSLERPVNMEVLRGILRTE